VAAGPFSSRAVVEQLWDEVRLKEEARAASVPELDAAPAMIHSRPLAYLNRHWAERAFADTPSGHRIPLTRRWIRQKLAGFVLHLFDPYFREERDFRGHLVQAANDCARAHDDLATEIRLLRDAIVSQSEWLAQRDLVFHNLAEVRRTDAAAEGERE
jgi:hypothetical protein